MSENFDAWDDQMLVVAARKGDKEARNALFMRHRNVIAKLCRKGAHMARSLSKRDGSITGEDVEQQAFLIFCDLLAGWEESFGTSFERYLKKTLPWEAVHYVRSATHYRSKRQVRRIPAPSTAGEEDVASMEAMQELDEVEDRADWDEQTGTLEHDLRRIIKMRYEQGLSSREIASLQGYSPRKVNRDLRAAKDALRQKLQDEWEDCG